MKLRLKGNSLRLRLGRSEVSRLLGGETLEESTSFGPLASQRLVYTLSTSTADDTINASFERGCVAVRVPREFAHRWATTDDLSMTGNQPIGNHNFLRLLIEKDLECLDPSVSESQDDAFANPHATACEHSVVKHGSVE